MKSLNNNELLEFHEDKNKWLGIFGGMTIINLEYLENINNKINLFNLIEKINNRYNRMSFERVLGCILAYHNGKINNSYFGDINDYLTINDVYGEPSYNMYIENFKNKKIMSIYKVFCGR